MPCSVLNAVTAREGEGCSVCAIRFESSGLGNANYIARTGDQRYQEGQHLVIREAALGGCLELFESSPPGVPRMLVNRGRIRVFTTVARFLMEPYGVLHTECGLTYE
jgi:hypothetical protein